MISVTLGFAAKKITVAVGRCAQLTRNMTLSLNKTPIVAVCQMTSTDDKTSNFQTCLSLIQRAKQKGAVMVCLPEACDYIAQSPELSVKMAEPLDGSTVSRFKQAAIDNGVWLSVGGYHQKAAGTDKRVSNTHLLISSDGEVKGLYVKTHLFDLGIAGKDVLRESDYTVPGKEIIPPVDTPVGKIGLEICYDLRFPEMSIALAQQGAHILTFPSAFTQTTGKVHWEVLLRSRAIETQCYVLAAAQTGTHNDRRSSYGHAMIVDPWGNVLAECQDDMDICTAEISIDYLERIRRSMPVWQHRRHDLYGHIVTTSARDITSEKTYQFGQYTVNSSNVFYRSPLSYAFVNIKPVVPGHVLVASLRCVERLSELTAAEVADLFCTVQKVSTVVEKLNGASAITVAVQDGAEAGQTVKHVHVHILPRKEGDFEKNDDIYSELQKHDSEIDLELRTNLRTEESMEAEANELRLHFS